MWIMIKALKFMINLFLINVPIFYPLKRYTRKALVFQRFQWVQNVNIGQKFHWFPLVGD